MDIFTKRTSRKSKVMIKEIEELEELVHKRTYRTGEVTQLRRIADAMDEILFLVKKDMAHVSKKIEEDNEEN